MTGDREARNSSPAGDNSLSLSQSYHLDDQLHFGRAELQIQNPKRTVYPSSSLHAYFSRNHQTNSETEIPHARDGRGRAGGADYHFEFISRFLCSARRAELVSELAGAADAPAAPMPSLIPTSQFALQMREGAGRPGEEERQGTLNYAKQQE